MSNNHLQPMEDTFTPLQKWEGYVIDINEKTFTARLLDLTANDEQEDEEADFPITVLSNSDQQILQLGSFFQWEIGYRRTQNGTRKLISWINLTPTDRSA